MEDDVAKKIVRRTFALDTDLDDKINAMAIREGRAYGAMVRRLIEKGLKAK